MRRALIAVATLASLVALVAMPACSRGGSDDRFELRLSGRAEITGERERRVDAGTHRVEEGDTIEMIDGEGVLDLPGERSVFLRAGPDDATVVVVAAEPEIADGSAVVVAGEDTSVRVGDVDLRVPAGAARVQRGLSVTVAMYAGSAEVRSAGRAFDGGLRALRQLSVPATGVLPREAVPLVYDQDAPDPWDLRFIGDAIDLGAELDEKSRGFTGQLPGARGDAALLREALPPLAADVPLDGLLGEVERTPGESLVGAAIVVETGDVGTDRWSAVFGFRDAGAQWGLVALDQEVGRDGLLDRINGAIGRSPLLFAAAPPAATGGGSSPPTTAGSPPTTGGGDDTTTSTTTPPPEEPPPPVTVPPITLLPLPEEDEEPSEPDLVDRVVSEVVDLLVGDEPAGELLG